MNIAMSKSREQFPLSQKKVLKKTVVGAIAWFILLGILLVFFLIGSLAGSSDISGWSGVGAALVVGLFGVIVVINYLYQKWYFSTYFYDLTADYIIIRKGPITPREITIPYERIQDVYVDQDLFDRAFGLFDVHLSSATISSGMEAHIDGVERAAADGLRNVLLKTLSEKIGRNRVTAAPPSPPAAAPVSTPINS